MGAPPQVHVSCEEPAGASDAWKPVGDRLRPALPKVQMFQVSGVGGAAAGSRKSSAALLCTFCRQTRPQEAGSSLGGGAAWTQASVMDVYQPP